jgi:rhodanese-related sulfurtransferase
MIAEISPRELQARLAAGEPLELIDVREPWEHQFAAIPGSALKPLTDFYDWARTLDPAGDYVLYCHTGARSAHACQLLSRLGFRTVANLRGGVDAWSRQVDSSIPRY